MQLTNNVTAPPFRIKDVFGRMIDLSEYKDKKILIAFFRHAGCPFCNLRVHNLTKIYPQVKAKGLEMIFFFESKESVILRSTFHKEVSPVPIIADPEKKWYGTYGLEPSLSKSVISHFSTFVQTALKAKNTGVPIHMMAGDESFSTMPAEFLVAPGLTIKKVYYSDRLNDRMDINEIVAFADTK
jgi:thioredoxin-dependent peroxiredoxin